MKLKDIAELANVSPSTVSLVMNGRAGVSESKRKEIIKLLDDYGYPVHSAKLEVPPAKGGSKCIRFIKCKRHAMLVDGNPGFINSIIDAVELECHRQGYELLITTCSVEQLRGTLRQLRSASAAGILLLGTELDARDIAELPEAPVPMVILDNAPPLSNFNCISMNNYAAIYHAVDHLVSYHHRQIGFLANMFPSNNCLERRDAFVEAMQQHGIPCDSSLIYEVHPTPGGAYQSVRSLLDAGTVFPPALVANNDSIALGAIKAFKEVEIDVPNDISVIGLDNIPLSSITDPPLTTMEVPCKEMGIWAVRLLCDQIRYPLSASTKMQISTKLLVRSSTAPYQEKHVCSRIHDS